MTLEEKYLIALSDFENAYVNYTKGSEYHRILRNNIQEYVNFLEKENKRLKEQLDKKENKPKIDRLFITGIEDFDKIKIREKIDEIIDYINEKEKKLEEKTKIEKISVNGKDIHKLEKLGIYEVIEDIESTLNEIIDKIEKESK